jgi:hypothetical protein
VLRRSAAFVIIPVRTASLPRKATPTSSGGQDAILVTRGRVQPRRREKKALQRTLWTV